MVAGGIASPSATPERSVTPPRQARDVLRVTPLFSPRAIMFVNRKMTHLIAEK